MKKVRLLPVILAFPLLWWFYPLYSVYTIDIIAIIAINMLLYGFYETFKTNWPQMYFTIDDNISHVLSISEKRYTLFRILPVLLVTSFTLSTLLKDTDLSHKIVIGVVSTLIHGITTNFVALYQVFIGSKRVKMFVNRYFQLGLHFFTIIAMPILGAVSGYLASTKPIRQLSPTVPGLIDNIWASIITAVVVIYFFKVYKRMDETYENVLGKAKENISPHLLELIEKKCSEYAANVDLVTAICIVENIQRPPWIRACEKMKSLFSPKGTYGIMQVYADHYLSDEDSIDQAIRKYFSESSHVKDSKKISSLISSYNPNKEYVETVVTTMIFFNSNSIEDDRLSY